MAKYGCVKNAYIKVAGVELSDHCTEMTPAFGNGQLPSHAMGDSQEEFNPGLTTRGLTAKFLNDFAAGSVFATLNPLKNGAVHVVEYRNDKTDPVTDRNPTFSGLFFITSAAGLIGGAKGANSEVTVTWAPWSVTNEANT
jgi:hypothetical protein